MHRRTLIKTGIAGAASLVAPYAIAQLTTSRPVRLVVPFPAGGPADLISRKIADLIGSDFDRPIIVDNKPGAAGVISVHEVIRSEPDGSTLGVAGPDALIGGPLIVSSAKYDARTDITKIMQVSYAHQVIFAHNSVGVTNLTDLIAKAKARPESISAVSWGPGSRADLVFKVLESTYGAKLNLVPYRGIPQAMQDLMTGTVQVAHLPPNAVQQLLDKNAGAALAVLGRERAVDLPRVPTSIEQGVNLPLLNAQMWNMFYGPKNLPSDITNRWVEMLRKVTASEQFTKAMLAMSQVPMSGRYGETLEKEFTAEQALIVEVSRKIGLKPA